MSHAMLTRDRPVVRGRAALLVIDVQNGSCNATHASSLPEFYAAATGRVIPNVVRLLGAFRAARLEVIHTVIENFTYDGRDRSLDYKLSGFFYGKGSWEARPLAEVVRWGTRCCCRRPRRRCSLDDA